MMTPEEALAEGALQIHSDHPNLCYSQPQIRGDAEAALAQSAAVVETDFSTQIVHQAPLETEACVAYLEEDEKGDLPTLVVIGRSINIHFSMGQIQDAVGYENLRYEEAYSGGQFGLKLDITSEGLAAAAALHFKRPVRYIPSLMESMWLTSKRHAFDMKVRLGARRPGQIDGLRHRFHRKQRGLSLPSATSWSIGRSVDALRVLLYSHHQGHGPACLYQQHLGVRCRGAGPPQVNYALECAIDMLAEKMGIDPLEFRLRNSLKPGQPKSTGRIVEQWPFPELIEAIRPHYDRARREAAEFNRKERRDQARSGVGHRRLWDRRHQGIRRMWPWNWILMED